MSDIPIIEFDDLILRAASLEMPNDLRAALVELLQAIDKLKRENARLRVAMTAIVDQEQHNDDAETHMHDMADLARSALVDK